MPLYKPNVAGSCASSSGPATPTRVTKRLSTVLQCFKPSRPTQFHTTSVHRCFLISEIFSVILDFVRQYDALSDEGECIGSVDRALGRRTLASLARTCRAFSAPALDLLWMRLDSLDPLIKVLPGRIWAKKHSRFVIRMLMKDKHWLAFRRYAVRVRSLRGPCRRIPPSIQRNVLAALSRLPKASLPLLPNLTELVWSESDTSSVIDPTVPLMTYFAGPRVTNVSLFLVSWPIFVSARAVLADLPKLCPNVTSFTALPRATFHDHSQDVGEIVSKWSDLRVLRSCPLSQAVIDDIASRETLDTLSVELNSLVSEVNLDKLPTMIHTFTLEGSNALYCLRYLQTLQGNPTIFRLHIGLDLTVPSDMEALFAMLPSKLDTAQLQNLTISSRSSFRRTFTLRSFPLTEPLLTSLYPFTMLVSLDLNAFCTSELDDAAYERLASTWPGLKCLKLGAADVSRTPPTASLGAIIAILKSCPYLEKLHVAFDASIPPPAPVLDDDDDDADKDKQADASAGHDDDKGEGELVITSQDRAWGVSNQRITRIHVGHSPAPAVGDTEGLNELVSCLKSVMPQLRRVRSKRQEFEMTEIFDMGESERWRAVQRLLMEKDVTGELEDRRMNSSQDGHAKSISERRPEPVMIGVRFPGLAESPS